MSRVAAGDDKIGSADNWGEAGFRMGIMKLGRDLYDVTVRVITGKRTLNRL